MKFNYGTIFRFLCVFLPMISMSGKVTAQTISPINDIVYEVYIQSFCDSNGDGIGDIPGLISKLDYIRDLGFNAIWIMPVNTSPSYHKYDVSDYYGIDEDYGTMQDMDNLIAQVHRRKMKLIMDMVINHTSSEHPWFIASASSPDSPYRQYYVWKDFETVKDEINKKTTTFDSDNLTQWHTWKDEKERYYGFFWQGMPDLNFDYPPLREEIYKACRFWLEKGIDGFRLDAAKHIYPDDQLDDTRKFWEEFTAKMQAIKPDVKIIGEVWSDSVTLSTLFKGLPSLFNFELTNLIPECINSENAVPFMEYYQAIMNAYRASNIPFEDAILLSNHDMNRIRSTLGGDIAKAKLAASILLTLPGTPYIYYGEELGMLGLKPDIHIREPFPWAASSKANTTWNEVIYSVPSEVKPAKAQQKDPSSLYAYYKKWIALRKAHPALAQGQVDFDDVGNTGILSYKIIGSDETLWIAHNLTEKEIQIPWPGNGEWLASEIAYNEENDITIQAYGSVLFRLKQNK